MRKALNAIQLSQELIDDSVRHTSTVMASSAKNKEMREGPQDIFLNLALENVKKFSFRYCSDAVIKQVFYEKSIEKSLHESM